MVATDNTNTYTCFIYPDAASAGNINGGLDWTNGENTGIGGTAARVGFRTTNSYNYELPDSGTDRVRGIDGVRMYLPFIYLLYHHLIASSSW